MSNHPHEGILKNPKLILPSAFRVIHILPPSPSTPGAGGLWAHSECRFLHSHTSCAGMLLSTACQPSCSESTLPVNPWPLKCGFLHVFTQYCLSSGWLLWRPGQRWPCWLAASISARPGFVWLSVSTPASLLHVTDLHVSHFLLFTLIFSLYQKSV